MEGFIALTVNLGLLLLGAAAPRLSRRRHGRCSRGVLGLALPGLDAVLPHGERAVDAVQLVVEAAGVADGLAVVVAPPQRRRRRPAVGAAQPDPPRGRLEHRTLEGENMHLFPAVLSICGDFPVLNLQKCQKQLKFIPKRSKTWRGNHINDGEVKYVLGGHVEAPIAYINQ